MLVCGFDGQPGAGGSTVFTVGSDSWPAPRTILAEKAHEVGPPARRSTDAAPALVHEYDNIKLVNVVPAGVNEVELALEQDNLVLLTHLHEPAMLHIIAQRFALDCIYTYTGGDRRLAAAHARNLTARRCALESPARLASAAVACCGPRG